ncbi:MAG TPA: BON domain-containing protein [Roseiarcus sp.]|nr:BON domain-containing protein [Roseiarcus sp.]
MLTPARGRESAQFADIPPGDADVLGRILNALYWDLAVPSDYLSVKVEKGWVTISGEVAYSYQKSCAEADVRRVSGVRGVSNEIQINPKGSRATGIPTGTGAGGAG